MAEADSNPGLTPKPTLLSLGSIWLSQAEEGAVHWAGK